MPFTGTGFGALLDLWELFCLITFATFLRLLFGTFESAFTFEDSPEDNSGKLEDELSDWLGFIDDGELPKQNDILLISFRNFHLVLLGEVRIITQFFFYGPSILAHTHSQPHYVSTPVLSLLRSFIRKKVKDKAITFTPLPHITPETSSSSKNTVS